MTNASAVRQEASMPKIFGVFGKLLNLSSLLSVRGTAHALGKLWLTPLAAKPPAWAAEFWANADQHFVVNTGDYGINVYRWGDGPVIIGMHGWRGSGRQFRQFIAPLTQRGYSLVLFDAPAHGGHRATSTSVPEFAEVLLAIDRQLGATYAVIAHSLGAMATVHALREGLHIQRLALLAPGLNVAAIYRRFCQQLGLNQRLAAALRVVIEQRMDDIVAAPSWQLFSLEAAQPYLVCPGVLAFDEDDTEITVADMQALQTAWSQAAVYQSNGLGHFRILKDPMVIEHVVKGLSVP